MIRARLPTLLSVLMSKSALVLLACLAALLTRMCAAVVAMMINQVSSGGCLSDPFVFHIGFVLAFASVFGKVCASVHDCRSGRATSKAFDCTFGEAL